MTCHNLHSPPPSYDLVVLNEYNEFLQYRANKQKYAQVASVVQHNVVADNSFVCVLQSNTHGSRVMDQDPISGNKSLLSSIVH